MTGKSATEEKKGRALRTLFSVIKVAILLAIVVGIPLYCYLTIPGVGEIFTSREALDEFLIAHKHTNLFIYLGIQALQVVISVIPGQVVQFAGGYVFGAPLAFLLTFLGVTAGTLAAFLLAKYLGRDIVMVLFKEKRVGRFVEMMNTKRAYAVIILVYLIPGIPKDVFTYAAGLTNLRALPFVLTSVVARSPAMLATLLFGSFLRDGNHAGMVIVAVVVGLLLALSFFKRKKLFAFIGGLHEKIIGK
ncbi:MAG: VTT domain-containing protein [Clostridiales Family XIII bacterium]|jgi:uncharacterized membrane protein YdjX (TVP38/TMEM64 family)|nr:VTT domain-containing protein [Clostridiales Family XIII bacterium]